jgi:116 kDa U5 small nuclear ribonucleoprotein component N-terminus
MDESLYDEFGNYIGPELPDSEDDSEESEEEEEDDIEPEDVTALVSMFALQRLHACSAMRANLPVHSFD